jgi:tetratricopeptide (TPR) repeat protein
MMPSLPKSVAITMRIAVFAACCLGIWSSFKLARADYLFREDTDQTIRSAIRLVPDGWPYYMRLAQFDSANAKELLNTSLQINPYDAQANIELGLQYEADGDLARAEKQLLAAYNVDHTYMPQWSLANYYFRRGNMPEFWAWARSAAAMPADDIGALLELCWRVSPDPDAITGAILNDKPEFLRQYVGFLIAKDQPRASAKIASHLLQAGDSESDLPVLLSVVNRLITEDDHADAVELWHRLAASNWVVADSTVPNNASFLRLPVQAGFDWSIPEYPGLHSWPGPSGLETEFSGSEPEDCVIAEQAVVLKTGNYEMTFGYQTSDIPVGTGVRWQILDSKSQRVLAESSDLSSDQIKRSEVSFSLPETSLIVLRLKYQRTLGTVRVSGMLNMQSVQIQSRANS